MFKRDFQAMAKSLDDPGRIISVATIDGVTISTVRLPDKLISYSTSKHQWETCLFYQDGNSEVVKTYDSAEMAKDGHDMFVIKQVMKGKE
jgi:hypothetical protein